MSANTGIDYIVKAKNNDYTINISSDNLIVGDQSIILMKDISKLSIIE